MGVEAAARSAADLLKANLANGNTFTAGSQILAQSTTAYSSLNIPVGGAAPTTPALGDVFTTTTDTHLQFRDSTNTTQQIAFLTDVSNATLTAGTGISIVGNAINNLATTTVDNSTILNSGTTLNPILAVGNIGEGQVTGLSTDLSGLGAAISQEISDRTAGDAAVAAAAANASNLTQRHRLGSASAGRCGVQRPGQHLQCGQADSGGFDQRRRVVERAGGCSTDRRGFR